MISPIFKTFCRAVMFNKNIVPPVSALNCSSSPTAVFFGVSKIVVNSVNRMLGRWAFPHVSKELFKRVPVFANRYASATIINVCGFVRVIATRTYTFPNGVFCSAAFAVRAPKRPNSFSLSAPARFDRAVIELSPFNGGLIPAVAQSNPISSNVGFVAKSRDCEAVAFNANKVKLFCHRINNTPTLGTVLNKGFSSC